MTTVYEVRYDRAALEVVREAAEYIEQQSGRDRAAGWLRALRAGIEGLRTSPRAFAPVCLRRGRTIHSKLVVDHRVFYFVDDASRLVYVIDIVHTARETRLAEYREPPAEGA